MTWTLYLLSQYPEVSQKLRDEIQSVIGESNDFSILQLDRLTYMGYVLKEVLRLFPPVSIVARRTTANTSLGEFDIPKDVCC